MAMRANALAVMAKAPLAGEVKTRLIPALSAEEAAELCRCLLVDQLQHLCGLTNADFYLAFTPAWERALMETLAPPPFQLFPQRGPDLGARMQNIFQTLHAAGHKNMLLMGGDLPPLPLSIFRGAFALLATSMARVVLGPSRDGGYYLVGCNELTPQIFERMTWSHSDVLQRTLSRLSALAIDARLLPVEADIDTVDDLRALKSRLDPTLAQAAKNTLSFIRRLGSS
jgi:rSAM/selenodomain-associated transferase 1